MGNHYSITRSQEAMRRLFGVARDLTGNLPSLPGVYPDSLAPIVRVGGAPITNIRDPYSLHWRRWLGPASRFPARCQWLMPRPSGKFFVHPKTRCRIHFSGVQKYNADDVGRTKAQDERQNPWP